MRTPLQILAAAGKELSICPETFDVSMGEMKGYVVAAESTEQVERSARRVVSYSGEVAMIPGRGVYKSNLAIIWDAESVKRVAEKLKTSPEEILKAIEQRLHTKLDFGDLVDLDGFFEEREF